MRRNVPHLMALSVLMAVVLPVQALELSLNGRSRSVLDVSALQAFSSRMDNDGGASSLALAAMFPWMESVDGLEARSGGESIVWNPKTLGEVGWENFLLVIRGKDLEIHAGGQVFRSPELIALSGIPKPYSEVRIWRAVECPEFSKELESALALRGISVSWRDVIHPAGLLEDPPADGLPDLLILDDLDLISLADGIGSYREIGGSSALWRASPGRSPDGDFFPMAADVRHPEAALTALLGEAADRYASDGGFEGGLETALSGFFEAAAAMAESGRLLVGNPIPALESGSAQSGFFPAGYAGKDQSAEDAFVRIDPPEGFAEIARKAYAAIPAGLQEKDLATLVLRDAARVRNLPEGASFVPDERLVRFFRAYDRLARLFFAGQLTSSEAAALISRYTTGQ